MKLSTKEQKKSLCLFQGFIKGKIFLSTKGEMWKNDKQQERCSACLFAFKPRVVLQADKRSILSEAALLCLFYYFYGDIQQSYLLYLSDTSSQCFIAA